MSVYRREGSKTYYYDFRYRGNRFHGTTNETEKRKAERFEQDLKNQVRANAIDLAKPLTFMSASTLYWQQVGEMHANSGETWRYLGWLQAHIGKNTMIHTISDATVADLVATRRQEGVSGPTINRTVIEPLRAIIIRARTVWKAKVQDIEWKRHILDERTVTRELTIAEQKAYFAELREDYYPIIESYLISGCRLDELVNLRWADVDWRERQFKVTGKGRKTRTIPLTNALWDIWRYLPRASEFVFTYVARQPRKTGARKGDRLPITYSGLKTMHRRVRARAGLQDFRFHDFRHTAASRLVRACGNLKIAQQLLGHEDIQTTARYAHLAGDEVRNAMEIAAGALAETRIATENTTKDDAGDGKTLILKEKKK